MDEENKSTKEEEWRCPECGLSGTYQALRASGDRGVDMCPNCSIEVECLD